MIALDANEQQTSEQFLQNWFYVHTQKPEFKNTFWRVFKTQIDFQSLKTVMYQATKASAYTHIHTRKK